MVAIIDKHVAKCGCPELPGVADSVTFAVDAGLFNDNAELIGAHNVCGCAGAMAPADKVSAGCFHQGEGEVMHPVRLRRSEAGPFAGWLLAPATQFQMMAIDIEAGFGVPANGADAERDFGCVDHFTGGP